MGYHETGREKVKNLDNKQEAKNEEEQLKSKRDSEKNNRLCSAGGVFQFLFSESVLHEYVLVSVIGSTIEV